jgi:hypothetical protein
LEGHQPQVSRSPLGGVVEMNTIIIPISRDLSVSEGALIDWLMNHPCQDVTPYIGQVGLLKVVGQCSCGCPTIDLGTEMDQSILQGPTTIIADALGYSAQGVKVGAILHVRQSRIAELEVYSIEGLAEFGLPRIKSLTVHSDNAA